MTDSDRALRVESALRSFAIDLLALCDELDVGAINIYADPTDSDGYGAFVSGFAHERVHAPGKATDADFVAQFSDFMGGDDTDD